MFAAIAAHTSPASHPESGKINRAVDQVAVPEGLNVGQYGLPSFARVYGQPTIVIKTIGPAENPIYKFDNGVLVVRHSSGEGLWGIGTVNTSICDGITKPKDRYVTHLGRNVRVGAIFFSTKGDEAKGEIGEPILVAGPIPKFGAKQPIYVGVDITPAKWTIGREVPFSRQWSCANSPTAKWNFKRTIQAGEGGEGIVRLVAGINMRDRQPGTCTLKFIVGRDTELASVQFVLE